MKKEPFPQVGTVTQRGITLVEMLVSMALLSIVTVATIALYNISQQSYRSVDTGQEMQDNARFAFETIGQSLRLAGYQEYMPRYDIAANGSLTDKVFDGSGLCPLYPVVGFNNSAIQDTTSANDCGGNVASTWNSSDTLAIRFFGVSAPSASGVSPTVADGSMIDCQGIAQPSPLTSAGMGISLFWVNTNSKDGEPELECVSRGDPTAAGGAVRNSLPIVHGVESFQVLYGVDTDADSIPNRWVSAQNVGTTAWPNVRAVRIGLVLRGPLGSSQAQDVTSATADQNKLYPLGKDFIGSSTEAGFVFTTPNDSRLRRAFSATFMLRDSL